MLEQKVIVGLAGAIHPNMPGDDAGVYQHVIQSLKALQTTFDFELVAYEKPIKWEQDGRDARAFLEARNVDLTLIFCASLPFGRAMLPLVRINSYLGIWSVPEPTTSGVLQLNSFCGLNMVGSIIAHYFKAYEIPFKWFYDYPQTDLFRERFATTLRAMRALKLLKNTRIGQIGELADGFENMYTDERILEEKFGLYIQTRHTVEDIVARAKAYDQSAVEQELKQYEAEGAWGRVTAQEQEKMARLSLAFLDFAREHDYTALAISCWSKFQKVYDVAVCAPMSRLNQAGIAAPCEADVAAAVNMLIFKGLNGQPAALNDLVALDEQDQSLNLWHCGVAARCWADANGVTWNEHFNIGCYDDSNHWNGSGAVAAMQFQPGAITICTMDNEFDNFFILTGDVMPAKEAYYGSSGWVTNLKMLGEPLSVKDLINTISVNRVNHHYPTAFGDLTSELCEFANWKKISILQKVPYQPYVQNPSY
jgi:L-fucose isomerase-like protein